MIARAYLIVLALTLSACAEGETTGAAPASYQLAYSANLNPASGLADVHIRISQQNHVLRVLDFNAPASQFTGFAGDGEVTAEDGRVQWSIPSSGGSLRFQATIDHLRGNVHDARITDSWAVLRLDDLFPAASARAIKGARAEATLTLSGPENWRFETPYGPSNRDVHPILHDRLFPRPVGWMLAGDIGVRRDRISERRVAVAAPVGEGFRRQDTLAFLRWTLPALVTVFPDFPERLLIVGSGVDMWRGGLSAPASLYMHPHRPLISGNGTSTLLHELVHVAMGDVDGPRDDWLVEGLAEYYALELLRRTGGISQRRFDGALEDLAQWATRENARLAEPSTGADTAYAVLVIRDLANQAQASGQSLDELVQSLLNRGLSSDDLLATMDAKGIQMRLPELPADNRPVQQENAE